MGAFDGIQALRERGRTGDIRDACGLLEYHAEERRGKDREWIGTSEANEELNRKRYRGQYVYVCNQAVVGHGKTMDEAGQMARKRTGIHPADMIQLMIPPFPWIDIGPS